MKDNGKNEDKKIIVPKITVKIRIIEKIKELKDISHRETKLRQGKMMVSSITRDDWSSGGVGSTPEKRERRRHHNKT